MSIISFVNAMKRLPQLKVSHFNFFQSTENLELCKKH